MTKIMGKVDIVVGIPSYNEADNIRFVTQQVDCGLQKYFSSRAVIVNVDNNSPDNTKDVFLKTETATQKMYVSTPPGLKGKGNNFYNLFRLCQRLGSRCNIVVDADLKSISPEWMKFLGSPILEGYDFVSPLYSRHKYDGTITNNIVYPLVYGLLNKNIRQPIGGDFAFSGSLVNHWMEQEWNETTRQFGIDNFMTTHAILGGFRLCQAGLGSKIHKVSQPKLNEMFVQVVTTLFDNIHRNRHVWEDIDKLEETVIYGLQEMDDPQNLDIDVEEMKKTATYEFFKNLLLLRQSLNDSDFRKIYRTIRFQKYDIEPVTWARSVYDLLSSFAHRDKNLIVQAIKPLYFARIVSFVEKTLDYGHSRAEDEIRLQAEVFRELKPYLLNRLQAVPNLRAVASNQKL